MISLFGKRSRGHAVPQLVFGLPPAALLVTAAYGHLECALGGGDGATAPFLFWVILFTGICENSRPK